VLRFTNYKSKNNEKIFSLKKWVKTANQYKKLTPKIFLKLHELMIKNEYSIAGHEEMELKQIYIYTDIGQMNVLNILK